MLDLIPARQRITVFKKNYRNSRQILRAASRLASHYGKMASALSEEIEVLDPELAQRETNPPIVLKTDNQVVKAWEIALECTADQKAEPWTACIVTASPAKISVDQILSARPEGLAARPLSGDCILHPDEVIVGTISDLKGFEFRLVLILGCDAGGFPNHGHGCWRRLSDPESGRFPSVPHSPLNASSRS